MSKKEQINDYLLLRLSESRESVSAPEFDKLLSAAKRLSKLGVDSSRKAKAYRMVRHASSDFGIHVSDDEMRSIISNEIANNNDAMFHLLANHSKSIGIKKVAYPSALRNIYDVKEQVDLKKWLKIVHAIYDAVRSGKATKSQALEHYCGLLDKDQEEDVRFKKWFKYYSDGEHLKYSSKQEEGMKKKSIYMSNLGQSAGTYTHGGGSSYVGDGGSFNMPGDSFDADTFDEAKEAIPMVANKGGEDFELWKSKLHRGLRTIDKLFRSKHMNPDSYKMLAGHLLDLSHQVHSLKLASTISDVTHKTANALLKHGQSGEAEILRKLAQQVPEAAAPEAAAPEAAAPEAAAPEAAAPEAAADPNDPKSAIPSSDEVEPASLKDITPIPGARQGEYEELAGEVSLDDAANKLDEVAGMLADRRIIRQLAEFDIMLDKIGIASMFPELAESQSKLIDSFSYALTRVTKMMGQLANAKSIIDNKKGLPGRDAAGQPAEPVAAEPTPAEPAPAEPVAEDGV